MRPLLTILLSFVTAVGTAQEIDSSWIANNRFPSYTRDTGIVLPDYTFIDENGASKKLSDFRGKILYIDIWTTWCAPCIGGFPHSKQLLKRLKAAQIDTLIQFVNICTEDSRSAWRKKLKQHTPVGVNLYSKDTSIYKLWDIASFPRYILVDASGQVMCYDFSGPDDGVIDYTLYAATKGIKPAEAIWIDFRQYQFFKTHKKYTDDAEGRDYDKWYRSVVNARVEYFKWRTARTK
jgi:thiol-disulfide isomerase/thioredoxin